MKVQIAFQEGGEYLDVLINPDEYVEIIKSGMLRGYKIALVRLPIEDTYIVFDNVLARGPFADKHIFPWRTE